jgi:hypothetical protein
VGILITRTIDCPGGLKPVSGRVSPEMEPILDEFHPENGL